MKIDHVQFLISVYAFVLILGKLASQLEPRLQHTWSKMLEAAHAVRKNASFTIRWRMRLLFLHSRAKALRCERKCGPSGISPCVQAAFLHDAGQPELAHHSRYWGVIVSRAPGHQKMTGALHALRPCKACRKQF